MYFLFLFILFVFFKSLCTKWTGKHTGTPHIFALPKKICFYLFLFVWINTESSSVSWKIKFGGERSIRGLFILLYYFCIFKLILTNFYDCLLITNINSVPTNN